MYDLKHFHSDVRPGLLTSGRALFYVGVALLDPKQVSILHILVCSLMLCYIGMSAFGD